MDGDGDLQLIEEPLLLRCRFGDAAEPDLAAVGGGQDDVCALQRGELRERLVEDSAWDALLRVAKILTLDDTT